MIPIDRLIQLHSAEIATGVIAFALLIAGGITGWLGKSASIRWRIRGYFGRYARREVTKLHTEIVRLTDERDKAYAQRDDERARNRAILRLIYQAIDIGHLSASETLPKENAR